MSGIFTISFRGLAPFLAPLALLAVGVLALAVTRAPLLVRIALRNVPRRGMRTALVIVGLALATMFISAALEIDETITVAVEQVAVLNLGRVDEDVLGGAGTLGLFPAQSGEAVAGALASDSQVGGVASVLAIPDVLVQDESTGQVRGGASAMGLSPRASGPLGRFTSGSNTVSMADLDAEGVYLNANMARLLNASVGDTLAIFSVYWPGQREVGTVRGIVAGGPFGSEPALVLPLDVIQTYANEPGTINHVYVANAGDGLSGVGASDDITAKIGALELPSLRVSEVKQDGIAFALSAEATFGRILLLFTLFALSVGLLLVFLTFALLADERRTELATLRALGLRRGRVVWLLLFEGVVYGVAGAALGAVAGLGLSAGIIALVTPTVARLGYPLALTSDPFGLGIAFCVGFLCTMLTIALAAGVISRLTVAAALRGLPEPPPLARRFGTLVMDAVEITTHARRSPGRAVTAWGRVVAKLASGGLLPLAVAAGLTLSGAARSNGVAQIVALVALVMGAVLLARGITLALVGAISRRSKAGLSALALRRATQITNRLTGTIVGVGMVAYWVWPTNPLGTFGLPRFTGNLDILFVAGLMLVVGMTLVVVYNLDLALRLPTLVAGMRGGFVAVARVVRAYPLARRFRTGVNLALLMLICLALVLMVCITSSLFATQASITASATGYDIVGNPLFSMPGSPSKVRATIAHDAPGTAASITALGSAQPIPIGVIQPSAPSARWSLYPAAAVQGSFLTGVGLPLLARAPGYASDAAVWKAVGETPGYAVIDIGALSPADAAALGVALPPLPGAAEYLGPPLLSALPGVSDLFAAQEKAITANQRLGLLSAFGAVAAHPRTLDLYTLRLQGVAVGPGSISATPLWVGDLRGGPVTRVTIIGLVADGNGLTHGLFASPATFAPIEDGRAPLGGPYYYFKLKPGVDIHQAAYSIGSALQDNGFEATALEDILVDVTGPRVFISRLLVGFLALTLIVSVAALVVTGASGVRERRQHIGMLRALGYRRRQVAAIFLAEAFLVGLLGTVLGLILGLLLCRNAFAAGFFDQFDTHASLVVNKPELALICGAALLATLFAASVPAWQAARVYPVEALRYE